MTAAAPCTTGLKMVLSGALVVLLASPVHSARPVAPAETPAPTDAGGWRRLAASDLDDLHRALLENHPAAYVDKDSRTYRDWVEKGYIEAKANISKVEDAASYYYLLQGYIGGFRDTHLVLHPAHSAMSKVGTRTWPGFATRWLHGRYVVSPGGLAAADVPPAGAELVSCDGKPAEQIARERLDRYDADLDQAAGRFNSAARLLWERGNVFVGRPPRRCTFKVGGQTRSYSLNYRPASQEQVSAASAAARAAAKAATGVAMWKRKVPWIGLPSSFTGEADWQRLYDDIEARKQEIRNAPLVIIDARGTVGGSSGYANRLARTLWNEPMLAAYEPHLGDVIWRVSPDNRAFFVKIIERLKKEPTLSPDIPRMQAMIARFDDAASRGEHTILERASRDPRPAPPPDNPMKGRVILLTDYSCVSACLDFMDLFLSMPNVEHAGIETNADTIFMEADRLPLKSGMFRVDIPHKAWVQRPRASNANYSPKPPLQYLGDPSDDAAQREWLAKALGLH